MILPVRVVVKKCKFAFTNDSFISHMYSDVKSDSYSVGDYFGSSFKSYISLLISNEPFNSRIIDLSTADLRKEPQR